MVPQRNGLSSAGDGTLGWNITTAWQAVIFLCAGTYELESGRNLGMQGFNAGYSKSGLWHFLFLRPAARGGGEEGKSTCSKWVPL